MEMFDAVIRESKVTEFIEPAPLTTIPSIDVVFETDIDLKIRVSRTSRLSI
jgi:hypothetical protein